MRRQNPVDCCSVNPEMSDQKINDGSEIGFKRRIEDFCTQVALKLPAQVSAVLFFSFWSVLCMGCVAVMNETCLPFR